MDAKIEKIKDEIVNLISPDKIILFGKKISTPTDEIKSIDLCIVKDVADKKETMRRIFVNIESEIQFNVHIYTCDEWERLSREPDSYAHLIKSRGTLLYGEQI